MAYFPFYVELKDVSVLIVGGGKVALHKVKRILDYGPKITLNVHSTQEEKETAGVFDDLIRISVGIEDIDDLIDDFKQAIESVKDVY